MLVKAILLALLSFACRPLSKSCLNESSDTGTAPFADTVLRQQEGQRFQLVATGSTDQSGAMLAFLSGQLKTGLAWKSPSGESFILSGATFIQAPGSGENEFIEFKVDGAGNLVKSGARYSQIEFNNRPIVRPLLRLPPKLSSSSVSPYLAVRRFVPGLTKMNSSHASSCGSRLTADDADQSTTEVVPEPVNSAAEVFAGVSEADPSPTNEAAADSQQDLPAPTIAPIQGLSTSKPLSSDELDRKLMELVRGNRSSQPRSGSAFASAFQLPQPVDGHSGLNHDGSYNCVSAGTVARAQHRAAVCAEARELSETTSSAYNSTAAALKREAQLAQNDLGIVANGGYFRYAPQIAGGYYSGLGDGGVFVADAVVNGVGGNIKRAGQIAASPITGQEIEDTDSILSSTLADSAQSRAAEINQTSGVPFGTIARGSANVGVQSGVAALSGAPQLIGRAGQGFFVLSDASDALVGSVQTAQSIDEGDALGGLVNATGTAFSTVGPINALRSTKTPNTKLVIDPDLSIRGSDVKLPSGSASAATVGPEKTIDVVEIGNRSAQIAPLPPQIFSQKTTREILTRSQGHKINGQIFHPLDHITPDGIDPQFYVRETLLTRNKNGAFKVKDLQTVYRNEQDAIQDVTDYMTSRASEINQLAPGQQLRGVITPRAPRQGWTISKDSQFAQDHTFKEVEISVIRGQDGQIFVSHFAPQYRSGPQVRVSNGR